MTTGFAWSSKVSFSLSSFCTLLKLRPFSSCVHVAPRVGRGTPHIHYLLWIDKIDAKVGPDDLDDVNGEGWEKVKKYVTDKLSCWLPPPVQDASKKAAAEPEAEQPVESSDDGDGKNTVTPVNEAASNFRPTYGEYDNDHPCSRPLDELLNEDFGVSDFGVDGKKGRIFDSTKVEDHFREVLLAVQMHHCCKTCHKYGHVDDCRFDAPWAIHDEAKLITTVDRNKRIKRVVEPPRNNVHINKHCAAPQVVIFCEGNTDNAFVGDGYGAAVYSASYSAKAEEPDCSLMANLIAKSLSKRDNPETKDFLRDTVNAMLRSVVVGATQACWFLLGLRYVRKTKAVISVNTLQKEKMTMRLRTKPEMHAAVEAEGEEATAVDSSPGSNLGRRITYGDFVKNQVKIADVCNPESCDVSRDIPTYSAFLSRYRLSRHKPSKERDDDMCDGNNEVVEGAKDAGAGTEDSSVLFASQKKPLEKKSSQIVWKELSVKLGMNKEGEVADGPQSHHFLIGNTRAALG